MDRPTLLVAASGGHLAELVHLWPRLRRPREPDPIWVTFESKQAQSLLHGEQVIYVPPIAQRDYASLARALWPSRRLVHELRPARVISTGSGVALAILPWAARGGIETVYIESAARIAGPSLTGRALARYRGIETLTQVRSWANERWQFRGSLLDGYEVSVGPGRPIETMLVMLGTQPYGFERLVHRLEAITPPEVAITWQLGATTPPSRGEWFPTIDHGELVELCRAADVVVGHAGAGTAMLAIGEGRGPVLVPRVKTHGEHVDDHQTQLAVDLAHRGLAVTAGASSVNWDDVLSASRLSVTHRDRARTIPTGPAAIGFVAENSPDFGDKTERRYVPFGTLSPDQQSGRPRA